MVKAGLMLEARTIAALSPVARMDRPAGCQKASIAAPASRIMASAMASLYQPPRKLSEPFASEKTVSVLTSDMVEEKPITPD